MLVAAYIDNPCFEVFYVEPTSRGISNNFDTTCSTTSTKLKLFYGVMVG